MHSITPQQSVCINSVPISGISKTIKLKENTYGIKRVFHSSLKRLLEVSIILINICRVTLGYAQKCMCSGSYFCPISK